MYNIDNTVEHSFWNKNFVLLIISIHRHLKLLDAPNSGA